MKKRQQQDERAELEWLRAAVKEGIDDIERGDYVTLRSSQEICDFMRRLQEEALALRGSGTSRR